MAWKSRSERRSEVIRFLRAAVALAAVMVVTLIVAESPGADTSATTLIGDAAFGDWTSDAPGVRRRLTPADLPPPFATRSAGSQAHIVPRPADAWPKLPRGFVAEELARGLNGPRLLRTAPNGDVFVAETRTGTIKILRAGAPGDPATVLTYAQGLELPFGLAFYPPQSEARFLYVATMTAVLRFPYAAGSARPRGAPEIVVGDLPEGGHWTRDVLFSADGRKMYVSIGSQSNDQESPSYDETLRANVLEFDANGGGMRRFATGLRNPVALALHPATGELWATVNERDGLGDNLPPDYVTRLSDGSFYGWPWYYIGAHQDPFHNGQHPELRDRVKLPNVLIQPHSAPLQLAVYTGSQFPPQYRNDLFVALHGSWNRSRRTGYKVVRVPFRSGVPMGEYEDFMTGFVTPEGDVWARPVGVTVAADGALLVSDDENGTIWRISYRGNP
jgi:glucose/arabinose dehydrogenase